MAAFMFSSRAASKMVFVCIMIFLLSILVTVHGVLGFVFIATEIEIGIEIAMR